ncbi:hypothetical protein O3G_MSEX005776 [Manduca sexta]|uniref:RRM domain-containing protein n=1 Tax=Manduca sexta TaxID=7130 RepID=A0A921Z094_MANSE|nr:hypothetical protein O3G_MSEX005776 [Manduca sexta]
MYFDEEDILHVVRRELFTLRSNLEATPYGLRSVPTHTEDGIPIRKLYVSNLPPKTTRAELFGVFAPYGFIKSCWLRKGDKGSSKNSPIPTYAFVTFSNPADAHKALQAPSHEKNLRGRNLRISPADSWHQPVEDADGRVRWKPRGPKSDRPTSRDSNNSHSEEAVDTNSSEVPQETTEIVAETSTSETEIETVQETAEEEQGYNILDILNRDCLTHILTYIPLRDLIISERVSKAWQSMVQEYLAGIRVFKTSWWQHVPETLTTAVLRRVLQRVGGSLTRLHIDHPWSALNDRTAHTVGKFCPDLEEFKVVGMHTKNWNPLIYGCKQLRSLSFVSCNKLTDSSLVHLVKSDSCIESLMVANNTHVTGLFLTGSNPPKLNSLSFYNCYNLQGTVLCAAIDTLPNLTTLKLDVCPATMWKIIPLILQKLPQLEDLSLSEYTSVEISFATQSNEAFCESLATLTELKTLNLSRNIHITNDVMKQVAQSCPKLESLNISSCNSRKQFPHTGVSDEGVMAICGSCMCLRRLDVSYLAALSDDGVCAAHVLPHLTELTARGNPALTAESVARCIASCHFLKEVDVCGCDGVSEALVEAARRALERRPRALVLRLAGTAAAALQSEFPTHKMLTVNVVDDRSNPNLRPDFVDRIFEDSSDDSLDELYDHDDFDDFFGQDDELFLDDELDDYEAIYAYGLHAPGVILL